MDNILEEIHYEFVNSDDYWVTVYEMTYYQ